MEDIVVSVLMTAYNREKYIAAAIDSVLASSYTRFELIIVDDISRDNTVAIARSYAEKDPRVKVFVNEKNLGDYPNRNKAAGYARGKYLKYVDADDYIYPWGLELLIEMMEQFPQAGYGLCSLPQYLESPFPLQLNPRKAYEFHYLGPGLFHKAPLSAIIRREVFQEINGFSPIRMAGDFEMWHRLSLSYPVVLMPQGMVWYRQHAEQEMKSHGKFIDVYEKISIDYLSDERCPLPKDVVRQVVQTKKKNLYKEMVKGVLYFNKIKIRESSIRLKQYKNR